jgi:thiamine biosynthesis lipoprotein
VPTLLALEAMATRFELVLEGDDPVRLRAAGEEALHEIERLDARLSRYRPASDISVVNRGAAQDAVPIDGEVLEILRICAEVSAESGGAFDVSVGALVDLWRHAGRTGRRPVGDAIAAARAACGMAHVVLDAGGRSVRFSREGLSLDLGAAGKGYAVDCAVERLREAGVAHALIHGGTSSVHAIGGQASGRPWPVHWAPRAARERVTFQLTDEALSISATDGGSVTIDGRACGHVIDPRTGEPVPGPRSAVVRGPRSFLCDMLSTACLVRGREWTSALGDAWSAYSGHCGS